MATTMNLQQNMGPTDRMIRGGLGALMLLAGLMSRKKTLFRKTESVVGGAFVFYGMTGFDPLLAAFGASTRAGDENHILNMVKSALPGQGYHPKQREQPVPLKEMPSPDFEEQPLAESLSIK
jgi:hypothetical protein